MSTISNREVALLALLSEESLHAYGIEKIIEDRSMRDWTEISMSSVYKLLAKLEGRGLISSEVHLSPNNVAQKVYSLTPAGLTALRNRLKEILREPEKIIYRIDLATSYLDLLDPGEIFDALMTYKEKLEDSIRCYGDLERYLRGAGCSEHSMALARRPMHLLRGELAWVAEYLLDLGLAGKGGDD